MIDEMERLFNQYNYIGLNRLKFWRIKNLQSFAKDLVLRNFYTNSSIYYQLRAFFKPNILNIKELSSIVHFPHARFNLNPRIAWQKAKIMPAPEDMPSDGMHL